MHALGVTICHDFIARLSCLVNIKIKTKIKMKAEIKNNRYFSVFIRALPSK